MLLILNILLSWMMFCGNSEHTGLTETTFRNFDLKKAWEFSLPSHVWRHTRHTSVWSAQPAVDDINSKKRIFIGAYDQNLYCIDAKTGKEVWRFQTSGKINHAPCIMEFDKKYIVFFASTDRTFYAVDTETGNKLWSFETQPWKYTIEEAVTSSPVGVKINNRGIVFVGFWNGDKKSIKPVELGEILSFDGKSGTLLWRKKISGSYINSPAVSAVNDSLFLFVTTRDGKVFAMSAENGNIIWSFTADGEIRSSPSVMTINEQKYLLFGTRFRTLFCVEAETGKVKWSYRAGHIIDSTPAVGELDGKNLVFFGSYDRRVYAVDGNNGKEIWRFSTGKYITASAAVGKFRNDLVVFINSLDDHIYALSGITGKLLWKFRGGKRLWDFEKRGESLWSSPAIYAINDRSYILYPSYDGKLYAFGEDI